MKVSPKQYAQLLNELVFETQNLEELDDSIKKFVTLLKKNKHQSKINEIIEQFDRLVREESGEQLVEIESSKDLSEETKENIKIAISHKKGLEKEKIKLLTRKNPHLIGGIRIKIGNEEIDGSVRSKLNRLQLSLT